MLAFMTIPMQAPAKGRRHYRTIWISDLHLGTRGCQAEALTQFLKQHSCDHLYLVGDIIDGWRLRKSAYWPQSHVNVIRRILTLAKRGTEVTYVIGNHDEFLRSYDAASYGNIHLTNEAQHLTASGRRLLVIHGDQFDAVVRCHRWLALLGDAAYEILLVLNRWYNAMRRRLGYGYWSLSAYLKQKVKRAVSYIGEFEQALARECRQRGFDGVVCGHIHHPEIRDMNGVGYLNCGDWVESCSALVEEADGSIRVIRWLPEYENNAAWNAHAECENEPV
ncbi:UDP-2,3-diacylglucosamine diphosphatase [Motiliproteus sediminis]|uniref:UDP-2,3-diacylglucosamine diphosphatase n=1 Tax=Motiliproteus sediminis TaxID=1468178 RepID=UPI001AEF72F0|nr:UDP-2,3-diacylglucosamine diphosphatase [Motiliproteus sediminis]